MNLSAADRKVIRSWLELASAIIRNANCKNGVEHQGLDEGDVIAGNCLGEITEALALLDRPQPVASQNQPTSDVASQKSDNPVHKPESAGDARELAKVIRSQTYNGVMDANFDVNIEDAVTMLEAFASRIRAETLEEAAQAALSNCGFDILRGDKIVSAIRSLKPTGTP